MYKPIKFSMTTFFSYYLNDEGVYCGPPVCGGTVSLRGDKRAKSLGTLEKIEGDLYLCGNSTLESFGALKEVTKALFVTSKQKLPPIHFKFDLFYTERTHMRYEEYLQELQTVGRASLTELPLLLTTVCCLVRPFVEAKMKGEGVS